jgi:small subunit ribosomal protein S2
VAVVDTNCSPDGVNFPIPGNDDAARAIALYCDLAARAALDGMSAQLGAAGVDLGAAEEVPAEEALEAAAEGEAAKGVKVAKKPAPKLKKAAKTDA